MILPNFNIEEMVNEECDYTGIDSLEKCFDKNHFKNYPHKISYKFNSRGFRDDEWPENLENCIWCFGDSFTVGLGQRYENIWPKLLQSEINQRTIVVSINGASNEWLSRKITELVKEISPKNIIVQWSYVNRRERILAPGESLTDMERRIWLDEDATHEDDIINTLSCIKKVQTTCDDYKTVIVHSFVPRFLMTGDATRFFDEFFNLSPLFVPLIQVDFARDYLHYDLKTSTIFVKEIVKSNFLNI